MGLAKPSEMPIWHLYQFWILEELYVKILKNFNNRYEIFVAVIVLAEGLDVHEITLKNVQNIDAIGIPRESFPDLSM